ncbi:gamma carbonic anhydrase family protein [Vineibacter terrae]|uniref:Gamma carbonic anhydrase family protein n=1 Tax=Vineibacter terrae TaxID=2586908 RepID=A0A5C8PDX2_9HYPH|nr:gamma carbonic anhydrase family protein [Vineibacter terrae]TXL71967.1 gamma carbonic anhydrase family protein [Vineibacter terrae]
MIVEHQGKRPRIGRDVYIAPNATICGDVEIGDGTAILFGAVVTADGGTLRLGNNCVVMENAVVRATAHHPMMAGDNVLIGPQAYAVGCAVDDNVFLAAGTRVFNGARIGARTTVRINGIVHLRTILPPDSVVPIGWVAVGDPPRILPPEAHDAIWAVQKTLDFPGYVFGVGRPPPGGTFMPEVMPRYARALRRHAGDVTA